MSAVRAYALYVVLTGTLYGVAAYSPPYAPFEIQPSALDDAIPFVPATAWAYATYFLLVPALLVSARRSERWREVFLLATLCVVGNLVLNLLLPTHVVGAPTAPGGTLLALLQRYDTPLCALPSGHVSLPVALTLGSVVAASHSDSAVDVRRWSSLGRLFGVWAIILAITAVSTKQHYLIDILVGAAWGAAAAAVYALVVRRRRERSARPLVHAPTLYGLCVEWSVIVFTLAAAIRWWHPAMIAVAAFIIATRQHALFILYHDGVHHLVSRSRRLNDFLTNLFVGVPQLLPVHLYRTLHLTHHRTVGAEHDPERVLLFHRQPWDYRPLSAVALARQLAGDLLLWNAAVTLVRYARERNVVERRSWQPVTAAPHELWLLFSLFAVVGIAFAVANPTLLLRLVLLWFIPLFTVMQLLQKIRSFAEHAGEGEGDALSYSWAPGLLGRLTIWPYNINYHREHHSRPGIPWDQLPATFPRVAQRRGAELGAHLFSGRLR